MQAARKKETKKRGTYTLGEGNEDAYPTTYPLHMQHGETMSVPRPWMSR
jgi:hypothetical protein